MSSHDERIESIASDVAAANTRLVSALQAIPPEAAEQNPPDGGWNAARIGVHVAITNEWVCAVLRGDAPAAQPAPEGFNENWASIAVPDRVQTFPQLVPPEDATLADALHRLELADEQVSTTVRGLSEERGCMCVTLPFGTLSLYQLAEFIGLHSGRHLAQLQRLSIPV